MGVSHAVFFLSYLCASLGTAFAGAGPSDPSTTGEVSGHHQRAMDYELSLETPGEVNPGQPMAVEVQIRALNGKKVNLEYPSRLQVVDGDSWELVEGSNRLEPHGTPALSATLLGTLKAKKSGVQDLKVRVSFSVCTDEQCLIEKVVLSDSIHVR